MAVLRQTNTAENLVHVFCEGVHLSLARSDQFSWSWFGGPSRGEVRGKGFEPRRLHHIATVHAAHVTQPAPGRHTGSVPLLYGMRFDGCRLRYRFDGDVTVTKIAPRKPSADWPYRDYPALLPYVPLSVARRSKTTWRRFAASAPNLPVAQPADLVALVPPPVTLGVSLWRSDGDLEGVTIVFECDLKAQTVDAYNVCS